MLRFHEKIKKIEMHNFQQEKGQEILRTDSVEELETNFN